MIRLTRLPKESVTRTFLYLDQSVSQLEQELWHTSVFQRLYFIRQLGFSDRVFPDAVHNRFNHVVGACQRAEDIIVAAAKQTAPANVPALAKSIGASDSNPKPLRAYIEARVDVARIMALLHDLTHIPFGHTLEDELQIFSTKHDDRDRQLRMFNRLTAQFVWGLYDDIFGHWPRRWSPEVEPSQLVEFTRQLLEISGAKDSPPQLAGLQDFLANLYAAESALIVMHHGSENTGSKLLLGHILEELHFDVELFDPQRDYFLIDAIGNTICADLLDYARRDMRMANIVGDYDDRIFRWFVLSEFRDEDEDRPKPRLAIKVFSNKFKPDILREIHKVLEIRYDLAERILFHPAKCCAGAMLGGVVETLGLPDYVPQMLEMGDEAFLDWVTQQLEAVKQTVRFIRSRTSKTEEVLRSRFAPLHDNVKTALAKRLEIADPRDLGAWFGASDRTCDEELASTEGALCLADRLRSRHYYQMVFEVTTAADDERGTDISEAYVNPTERAKLVHEIEDSCGLPSRTVLIHCPRRKTNFKEAQVLILYDPQKPPIPLCEADRVPQLKRMALRARDLAEDYKSIWRLRVFLHKGYRYHTASVVNFLSARLEVPNSDYLKTSLELDPAYVAGEKFLERFGGHDGRSMLSDAVQELQAARKGLRGPVSFADCLERQSKKRTSA